MFLGVSASAEWRRRWQSPCSQDYWNPEAKYWLAVRLPQCGALELTDDVASAEDLHFGHFELLNQRLIRNRIRSKQHPCSTNVVAGGRKRLLQRIGEIDRAETGRFVHVRIPLVQLTWAGLNPDSCFEPARKLNFRSAKVMRAILL